MTGQLSVGMTDIRQDLLAINQRYFTYKESLDPAELYVILVIML